MSKVFLVPLYGIKIIVSYGRSTTQNGRWLQLLHGDNIVKTEDANFIALHQVNSSLHYNTFYTARKVIS